MAIWPYSYWLLLYHCTLFNCTETYNFPPFPALGKEDDHNGSSEKRFCRLLQQLSAYGLSAPGSPEALEASNLCGHLAIQFSVVEEEYLSIMGGGSRWHLTSRS